MGLLTTIAALVAGALGLINLFTFIQFWRDKRAARRGDRRVPEATLLKLALMGGAPAAVLASRVLRHKTRKQPFVTHLYLVIGGQAALLGWWIWAGMPLPALAAAAMATR